MQDIETGNGDSGYPHDWRGNDLGVYSKVILNYPDGTELGAPAIGVITDVERDRGLYWFTIEVKERFGNHVPDVIRDIPATMLTAFHEGSN